MKNNKKESVNINIANRSYNTRMRNIYYLKIEKKLKKLHKNLLVSESEFEYNFEFLEDIKDQLIITCEFAEQSVALSPAKIKKDLSKKNALIFKEEILFIHLLNELKNFINFLISRSKLINEIVGYKKDINLQLKSIKKGKGNYISEILEFIEIYQESEHNEIKDIIKLIVQRTERANNIFSILNRMEE